MKTLSAGLLMYRNHNNLIEVLLVHPGGPFWAKKDYGAWTLPKGEVAANEEPLSAARREFQEELGLQAGDKVIPLGTAVQKGGKTVQAWAFEGDCDVSSIRSNTFRMEWPPRSGKQQEFPEIDRAEFFSIRDAQAKVNPAQQIFLTRLVGEVLPGKSQSLMGNPTGTEALGGQQGMLFE